MRWKTTEYTGWGRALTAQGRLARPEKMSALSSLMAQEPAPAIGNCRTYGDGCLNDGGDAVAMTRLDRLLSLDSATGELEVEAGVTLDDLLVLLPPRGWRPAVVPGSGFVTVGGAIANDVHGKNHHIDGSFGQHVTEITLIGVDGTVQKLKPGSDLFRATVGGLGQTGIIAAARLQLASCPNTHVDVTERRMAGIDAFIAAFDESTAPFSVGWVDATARGPHIGRGIMEEAVFSTTGRPPKLRKARKVPMDAPGFLLSGPTVTAFNQLYYRRIPPNGRRLTRTLRDFFCPLDGIHDWNRLYGKRGFHQFQCVLPDDTAPRALREMLGAIAKSGRASPLAVLKKMGPGRAGHLSFPMQGYTLAVDAADSQTSRSLITRLNGMTASAGGRIYLAKDSLLTPDLVPAMLPELGAWREIVAKADPAGAMQTDLVRRLQLRNPA